MKHPVRKMIIALVLAAVLLVPAFFFLRNAFFKAADDDASRRNYARLEGFGRVMEDLLAERNRLETEYLSEQMTDFRLETSALMEYVNNDHYTGPDTFENGFVLRIRNGEPVYPEDWSAEILPLPEDYQNKDTALYPVRTTEGEEDDTGMYCRLAADVCAMKLIRGEEVRQYVKSFLDVDAVVRTMERVYNGHLALFDQDGVYEGSHADGFLPENASVDTMGLDLTGDPLKPRVWIRDGKSWRYIYTGVWNPEI